MNMFYLINNKIVILQNRSGVKSRKVTGKRKSNGSVTSRFCEKGYPDKIRSSGQCGFHLSKPRSPGGVCNTRCIWSIIGGCPINEAVDRYSFDRYIREYASASQRPG
jgi:hypothetical protein